MDGSMDDTLEEVNEEERMDEEGMDNGGMVEDGIPRVNTFSSTRGSSILAAEEYQEDYEDQKLLPLSLERMSAGEVSEIDQMSPVDGRVITSPDDSEVSGLVVPQMQRRRSSIMSGLDERSERIGSRRSSLLDGGIMDDPFEVRSDRGLGN